jgi:hypothetical protein
MRHVAGPVRNLALSFSLSLALAACGSSSGTGTPDGAAGADGAAAADGGAAGVDGGAAGADGGGAGTTGTGSGGADGGAAGAGGGVAGHDAGVGPDVASDAQEAGGGDAADAAAAEAGDAPDAADAPDAVTATDGGGADTVATNALCTAFPINAPAATVTIVNSGKVIDTAAFSGGTLASGTYWLTSVSHFGATYTGVTQEILIVDASAKTVEDEFISGGVATYRGFSYTTPSATTLAGTPVCGGTTALSAFYTVTGVGPGATVSLNATASSDVKIFTRQ